MFCLLLGFPGREHFGSILYEPFELPLTLQQRVVILLKLVKLLLQDLEPLLVLDGWYDLAQ